MNNKFEHHCIQVRSTIVNKVGKSLMNIEFNNCPSTDPCGTPLSIGRKGDIRWLTVTHCCLLPKI